MCFVSGNGGGGHLAGLSSNCCASLDSSSVMQSRQKWSEAGERVSESAESMSSRGKLHLPTNATAAVLSPTTLEDLGENNYLCRKQPGNCSLVELAGNEGEIPAGVCSREQETKIPHRWRHGTVVACRQSSGDVHTGSEKHKWTAIPPFGGV